MTETLPSDFSYVNSSLDDSQVTELANNQVRFTLQGDTSFTYTVTASDTPGDYDFSGTLRDADRMDHTVGGAVTVTVEAPPDITTPTRTDITTPTPDSHHDSHAGHPTPSPTPPDAGGSQRSQVPLLGVSGRGRPGDGNHHR